jgi:hypothetical protein
LRGGGQIHWYIYISHNGLRNWGWRLEGRRRIGHTRMRRLRHVDEGRVGGTVKGTDRGGGEGGREMREEEWDERGEG